MTKSKPKAYRGVQSYLTEEQIRMLEKNPNIIKVTDRQVHYTQTFKNYFCREYAKGRSSTDINADMIHMIGKLEQQIQYLEKETDFLKKIFAHDYLKQTPHKRSQKNLDLPLSMNS